MGRPAKYKQYEIGDIIEDNKVVCIKPSIKGSGRVCCCECVVCGRKKDFLEATLRRESGTKHSACGKGLKTLNKKFYNHWQNLRTRTTNENYHAKENYKNISSDSFENFIDFYDDMYEDYLFASNKFGEKNISLDRINSDGDYEKDNLRWTTPDIQASNTSRNRLFSAKNDITGEEIISSNQTKFAKKIGCNSRSVNDCLRGRFNKVKGWKVKYLDSND